MKSIKPELIAGFGLIFANAIWNWCSLTKRGVTKKLTTRHAKPGVYYLEGQLESSCPSEYNNHQYAKLICTTNQAVRLPDDEMDFSRVSGTTITQIDPEQKLTIESFDVTELLDRFPLTTVRSTNNSLIQGVPVGFGTYRVIGYWDGEKMIPVTQTRVVSELAETRTTNAHWSVAIIGASLILSGMLVAGREKQFF